MVRHNGTSGHIQAYAKHRGQVFKGDVNVVTTSFESSASGGDATEPLPSGVASALDKASLIENKKKLTYMKTVYYLLTNDRPILE